MALIPITALRRIPYIKQEGVTQSIATVLSGKPLTVKTLSFVTKVLLQEGQEDEDKPTAFGVEVQEGKCLYSASIGTTEAGETKKYFALKEVIVSGGAFNTPQILMQSGIGPKDHLEDHDIEVTPNTC
jgi:choline dehydrogenase